jgi:hypothetical protein
VRGPGRRLRTVNGNLPRIIAHVTKAATLNGYH